MAVLFSEEHLFPYFNSQYKSTTQGLVIQKKPFKLLPTIFNEITQPFKQHNFETSWNLPIAHWKHTNDHLVVSSTEALKSLLPTLETFSQTLELAAQIREVKFE